MSSQRTEIFQTRLTRSEASAVRWHMLQCREQQKAKYVRLCLLAGGGAKLQELDRRTGEIMAIVRDLQMCTHLTRAEKARLLRVAHTQASALVHVVGVLA